MAHKLWWWGGLWVSYWLFNLVLLHNPDAMVHKGALLPVPCSPLLTCLHHFCILLFTACTLSQLLAPPGFLASLLYLQHLDSCSAQEVLYELTWRGDGWGMELPLSGRRSSVSHSDFKEMGLMSLNMVRIMWRLGKGWSRSSEKASWGTGRQVGRHLWAVGREGTNRGREVGLCEVWSGLGRSTGASWMILNSRERVQSLFLWQGTACCSVF